MGVAHGEELADLAQLEDSVSELEAQIHAIETSWSWRVIKAVRQLVHRLIG